VRILNKALAIGALAVLAGCATDFNTRLATGYSAVTGVRQTTTTLLRAEKVSAADAQNVQDTADKARVGLDIARDVHATTPDLAEDKLKSATTILQSLRKYLSEVTK
jgi:hypothetical protein